MHSSECCPYFLKKCICHHVPCYKNAPIYLFLADLSPKTRDVKKPSVPKNKDAQQLSNMGMKLFMTREDMQTETADMIKSANKVRW